MAISKKVRFKKVSAKALTHQVGGVEPPYDVYRFGSTRKFERPNAPGNQYRWLND